MAAARPGLGRVHPGSSILFLCDMQEKFRHGIAYFPQIVSVAARMLRVGPSLLPQTSSACPALSPQTSSARPASSLRPAVQAQPFPLRPAVHAQPALLRPAVQAQPPPSDQQCTPSPPSSDQQCTPSPPSSDQQCTPSPPSSDQQCTPSPLSSDQQCTPSPPPSDQQCMPSPPSLRPSVHTQPSLLRPAVHTQPPPSDQQCRPSLLPQTNSARPALLPQTSSARPASPLRPGIQPHSSSLRPGSPGPGASSLRPTLSCPRPVQVARLLGVPAVLTEQYPQGLGPTVPELGAEGLQPLSKTCFSMVPAARQELDSRPQLQSVLLCGIEAQACILNTALDLLDRGLQVHVVADACSSRSQVDRLVALARMRQSGAFLCSSEGLILQLVGDAAHPQFKESRHALPMWAPWHSPGACPRTPPASTPRLSGT
uniref:Isochorismatase-like domain-containing protein n=1 Tax=Oryctolagus cuniculus TaxID=9986 RepID=A0A5F9CEW0_RABIT